MMVAHPPYSAKMGHLLKELDHASQQLTEITKQKKVASSQELSSLIKVFYELNENFDPRFWGDKKLVPEEMSESIGEALKAIQLFQSQPSKDKAIPQNVNQAIVSLFATLTAEINKFDKHLKNLREFRIGLKVEKTGKSKQS